MSYTNDRDFEQQQHGPRVTYAQDWPRYNAAQVEEGRIAPRLLAALCENVQQPEQHRGRPRLPLSDAAFAVTMKVFSGFSSRRFSSALETAAMSGMIERPIHYNSVNNYLADPAMTPVLKDLIEWSSAPLSTVESQFAIDSTGFSTSRFGRWYETKYGKTRERRQWVKLHAMIGTVSQIVTAVEVTDTGGADSPQFVPLLFSTAERFDMREVSADRAYLSHNNAANTEFVGATPYIPFKSNTTPAPPTGAWGRMYHRFAYDAENFAQHYHQRSNVESAFSAIKRKFGDSLRTKTEVANHNETLAKVLCHNLSVTVRAMHQLGIEPEFGRLPVPLRAG